MTAGAFDTDAQSGAPFTVRQAVLADLDLPAPLLDQYRQFYKRPSDLEAAQAFLRGRFHHGERSLMLRH